MTVAAIPVVDLAERQTNDLDATAGNALDVFHHPFADAHGRR